MHLLQWPSWINRPYIGSDGVIDIRWPSRFAQLDANEVRSLAAGLLAYADAADRLSPAQTSSGVQTSEGNVTSNLTTTPEWDATASLLPSMATSDLLLLYRGGDAFVLVVHGTRGYRGTREDQDLKRYRTNYAMRSLANEINIRIPSRMAPKTTTPAPEGTGDSNT